jgi:hypothetical protein
MSGLFSVDIMGAVVVEVDKGELGSGPVIARHPRAL